MLAMGRALMSQPKTAAAGRAVHGSVAHSGRARFSISSGSSTGTARPILLVEQNAKMALEIANRAYVLETGTIKMEGEATELANNIEVRKAYLGCE